MDDLAVLIAFVSVVFWLIAFAWIGCIKISTAVAVKQNAKVLDAKRQPMEGSAQCVGPLLLFVVSAMWIGSSTPAMAARPGFRMLDLVVDQEVLDSIGDRLVFSDDQRFAIDESWEPYFSTARELDQQSFDEAMQVLNETEARLKAGEVIPAEDEDLVWKVGRDALKSGDRLMNDWIDTWSPLLSEIQRSKLPDARRLIDRMNAFVFVDDPTWSTMKRPYSLLDLLDEQLDTGGPLAGLMLDKETASQIRQFRAAYELSLGAILAERFRSQRRLNLEKAEDLRTRGRKWFRLERLRASVVESVAMITQASLGISAATEWERAHWKLLAPKVAHDLWFDHVVDWVNDANIDGDQLQEVNAFITKYEKARHELIRSAVDSGIGTIRHELRVWGTSKRQLAFAGDVLAISDHHDATIERFQKLLTDEQKERFLADLKSARIHQMGLFDVGVPDFAIVALGREISQNRTTRHRPNE